MTAPGSDADQLLELPGFVRDRVAEGRAKARATKQRKAAEAQITERDPVAQVLVDLPLAHLDRPFDYAVPVAMDELARPGVRVKVRFAGQDVDGYLLARVAHSDHPGRLAPLRRVVSAERVLSPQVASLTATIAERYAGTRSDVLRLAVPARHATAERETSTPAPTAARWDPAAAEEAWAGHEPGGAFLRHLRDDGAPRSVWHAAAGTDWPLLLAQAAAATLAGGRGSLLVVPDRKAVARLSAALGRVLGPGHHVALTADAGPAERYRSFLAVSRGAVRVVVGTRAAAFAPVHDLGLVALWDDGDDNHAEQRAPYPHAREVLLLRAAQERAAALIGGFALTVEADQLARTGWAHPIAPSRALARGRAVVGVTGATDFDLERDPLARVSRVPRDAFATIKSALELGPVLVQTPRRGYAAALACDTCRTPARCRACTGPLQLTGPVTPPRCRWCGTQADAWACSTCGGHGLRAPIVGDARTAEELGRAFPGVRVVTSSGDRVLETVPGRPAIVVATPGAEPAAESGYAAVLLLDTWLALGRPDLRTEEEALRRWSNAAGLVMPAGRVLLVGDPAHPAVQALVRWDQPGFAAREAEQRALAHLPPASRLASLTGDPGALADARTLLTLPEHAELLGPVPVDEQEEGEEGEQRLIVRVPRTEGAALSAALGELQRLRSARRLEAVRIQVDPPSL
ncbi:primosomal protein N' [Nocardioides sp. BP30]|uniref:primosomal protein N' n=1 Tax=Nocardioides sp. BP30 TaxID=3036374 RepID=UPI002468FF4B|nr:primosomal protein N' [Nocardioides sp. BP30]WGL50466.1 primosomal protein N' [Nocardioides sp. BP30]